MPRIAAGSENVLTSLAGDTGGKVPVIDCHAHVGTARMSGTPYDLTDNYFTFNDPKLTLRHMEEGGIDVSIICSIENITYKEANEEVAEICHRYPGKFIAFARHHPEREKGQLRSLLFHEVRDLGFRGVGELHEEPSREMLDIIRELRVPLLYHPDRVALYQDFVADYPDINFILCHLGSDNSGDWREHLAGIQLTKTYPNVYLDTSTVIITPYLIKAVRELPAEKLIFGSDSPADARLEVYKIRMQNLPKEKEELILGGNMLRLLGGRL